MTVRPMPMLLLKDEKPGIATALTGRFQTTRSQSSAPNTTAFTPLRASSPHLLHNGSAACGSANGFGSRQRVGTVRLGAFKLRVTVIMLSGNPVRVAEEPALQGLAEEETVSAPQESERDRLSRNLGELLQELRVAQGGVQILFGFLLTVVFTGQYASAGAVVHGLHLVAVLLAVAATALLTATAAWHRMLFRQRQRVAIIRSANWMALAGLGCLAGAITATLGLIVDVVLGGGWALLGGVAVGLGFVLLWFVMPCRLQGDH